jgi:glycerol-3-phosphate acyltransferase PlsX
VDVIVTDGFTGNIALKTAEGVAQLVRAFLRRAFAANIFTKIAYLFARPALSRVRSMINPNAYNGAVFLGLNGISVKSHGGTNAFGYANAIGVAADMVKNGYLPEVSQAIAKANLILNEEKRDENG